jgi:hypothetical protein
MNTAYSFLDTHAAIVGPGGSFQLGAGCGVDDEGITVEPAGEMSGMTIGADGEGFHNLYGDKSGHITVRLLKTSPANALLAAMAAFQRQSASLFGQNVISITNTTQGDAITAEKVAFAKLPVVTWAKDGRFNEWRFNAVKVDFGLGGGV